MSSFQDLRKHFGPIPSYVISYSRTPFGYFLSELSNYTAIDLACHCLESCIKKSGTNKDEINELIVGNALTAGLGQSPDNQIKIKSGLKPTVNSYLVNKVCCSGIKAISLADYSIKYNLFDLILVVGTESMSNVPHYIHDLRKGKKYGDWSILDSIYKDGLEDALNGNKMGMLVESVSEELKITREMADNYAIKSFEKAGKGQKNGFFQKEICPIKTKSGIILDKDEGLNKYENSLKNMRTAKPLYKKDGILTALNICSLNDGAAALLIASQKYVEKNNIRPLGRIVESSDANIDSKYFGIAPEIAAKKTIERAKLNITDISLFEFNDPFSSLGYYNSIQTSPNEENVNIHGGSIVIGHPLGASGTRIVGTLCNSLNDTGMHLGCASICNGGGGATSIIIERI